MIVGLTVLASAEGWRPEGRWSCRPFTRQGVIDFLTEMAAESGHRGAIGLLGGSGRGSPPSSIAERGTACMGLFGLADGRRLHEAADGHEPEGMAPDHGRARGEMGSEDRGWGCRSVGGPYR